MNATVAGRTPVLMKSYHSQHLFHQLIVLYPVFGRREHLNGQYIAGIRRGDGRAEHGIAFCRLAGIQAQEFMPIGDFGALADFLRILILGFQTGQATLSHLIKCIGAGIVGVAGHGRHFAHPDHLLALSVGEHLDLHAGILRNGVSRV